MAEQNRIQASGQQQNHAEEEQIHSLSQTQNLDQSLVQDADDLLAEIDGLLEENAEEFVKSFVQKGGE